jgi:hypothetical protein
MNLTPEELVTLTGHKYPAVQARELEHLFARLVLDELRQPVMLRRAFPQDRRRHFDAIEDHAELVGELQIGELGPVLAGINGRLHPARGQRLHGLCTRRHRRDRD